MLVVKSLVPVFLAFPAADLGLRALFSGISSVLRYKVGVNTARVVGAKGTVARPMERMLVSCMIEAIEVKHRQ